MEIAQPKPRLDSPVVREAFFRFFESHKADDWPEAHIRRNLRLIVIFKEFAANIRARLYGTKFSLLDGKLWGNCEGPFAELFGDVLDQQETKLFLAFVKPKLQELVLDLSLIKPYRNDQLINYFVGTPHLVIMETKSYESGYPLLEKLAPDVTKFKCPSAYLQYDLPPMSLETCVVEIYDQPKINLGPLCSKSQIRQLRLEIQHRLEFRDNFREFEIVCGGRYRNLSVEELILIDDHDKRVHLPDNLLECFPNLKRVFLSFFVCHWLSSYDEHMSTWVECAREWVQKSPDLRFVIDVCYSFMPNHAALLSRPRELGLLGDEEPLFMTKKELENDPDIKSCRRYESEHNHRILVCSTGQIKSFFWYK